MQFYKNFNKFIEMATNILLTYYGLKINGIKTYFCLEILILHFVNKSLQLLQLLLCLTCFILQFLILTLVYLFPPPCAVLTATS